MMGIDDMMVSFAMSYIAGNIPQIKGWLERNKGLQEEIGKCYDRALKQWSVNSGVRDIERYHQSVHFEELKDVLAGKDIADKWYVELVRLWIEELRKNDTCYKFILEHKSDLLALKIDGGFTQVVQALNAEISELHEFRHENRQQMRVIEDKIESLAKNFKPTPELKGIRIIPSEQTAIKLSNGSNLHISLRRLLVQKCTDICNKGKVLVLYGGVKVGKKTLAELIVSNFNDGFICLDVPSGELEYVIRICEQEAKEGRKPIITTQVPLDTSITLVDTTQMEQVEVPLLNKEETIELIKTYSPQKDYCNFIYGHSYGHPVLVRALCTYLSSCNWVIDETVFGKMLSYSFDHQLARSLAELMKRMIPDADSRNLLNRMMLVKSTFSEDDVVALAGIKPQISEPRSRLLMLQPGWVTENEGTYRVTPLYDKAWTPDMNQDCYKACNWLLASRVFLKPGALNELDVLNYIHYAQNAEKYEEAGIIYVKALGNIQKDDIPKLTILPMMWTDVPLPQQMSEQLRIIIRSQQLMTFNHLSTTKRKYILTDLCRIVENIQENELTSAYYSMLSVLCMSENLVSAGLNYYNLSLEKKNENSRGVEDLEEMGEMFKKSTWILPLRFSTVEEYVSWLDSFATQPFEYDHNDKQLCEYCYLSGYQLVNNVWKGKDSDRILSDLQIILKKAIENHCPEMAISILFEIMESYNRGRQYGNTIGMYKKYYDQLKEYPLATVLLNGSMANALYLDKDSDNTGALYYIDLMQKSGYEEIIPNIHLHMKQIRAYIVCETNIEEGIDCMKDAVNYAQISEHVSTPYEYYQSLGELSFLYWKADEKVKAAEAASECVSYVIDNIGQESPFAKTFLCLCDTLLVYYLSILQSKELPETQARPQIGMFTELDPVGLDNQYSVDRIFTSSYLMYQMCDALKIDGLRTKWAYKVLHAIKTRGESKEIHYIATLLVPIFLKEHDLESVASIAEISSASQSLAFTLHPEMKRESADAEFVEYVVLPALFLALRMAITGDTSGLKRIHEILNSYNPVVNEEVIKKVISVFEQEIYDLQYIEEIKTLEMNRYYPVYLCAYLITTLSVDATQAFKLIMAVIVRLESDLRKVMGGEIKEIINDYISAFWRAKIITSPGEFRDYKFLANKGMAIIEDYKGKENEANHTMFVVRNHLLYDVKLNDEQEEWLDA